MRSSPPGIARLHEVGTRTRGRTLYDYSCPRVSNRGGGAPSHACSPHQSKPSPIPGQLSPNARRLGIANRSKSRTDSLLLLLLARLVPFFIPRVISRAPFRYLFFQFPLLLLLFSSSPRLSPLLPSILFLGPFVTLVPFLLVVRDLFHPRDSSP